jgi:hypothetical protein
MGYAFRPFTGSEAGDQRHHADDEQHDQGIVHVEDVGEGIADEGELDEGPDHGHQHLLFQVEGLPARDKRGQ